MCLFIHVNYAEVAKVLEFLRYWYAWYIESIFYIKVYSIYIFYFIYILDSRCKSNKDGPIWWQGKYRQERDTLICKYKQILIQFHFIFLVYSFVKRCTQETQISDSSEIESNTTVVAIFLSILNPMEFHLVKSRRENFHHDHIPFNLERNKNSFSCVCAQKILHERIFSKIYLHLKFIFVKITQSDCDCVIFRLRKTLSVIVCLFQNFPRIIHSQ